MRVLLVEDDRMLGDGLSAGLRAHGHGVDWVRDGEAALAALDAESFAVVVLDLGLPRRDGLSVLQSIRSRGDATPVLVLTARDDVRSKVEVLDLGADDYVLKPFDLDELTARLRALVRRSNGRPVPVLRNGSLEVNPATREVRVQGESIALTSREFDLLSLLIEGRGRVQTRRVLEEQLYAWGESIGSNALEVHVHHLRRKIGGDLIRTVRGVGYMMMDRESAEA